MATHPHLVEFIENDMTSQSVEQKMSQLSVNGGDLVMYVPLHSNLGQVEHTAAFLTDYPSKLFLYEWNTGQASVVKFYSDPYWKKIEAVTPFSVSNLLLCLEEERKAKRRVVFLLTSSINYSFGNAQQSFFEILKSEYPDVIADIFSVGHCLFGCQSCGIREHNVPVYLTRFHKDLLPYSKHDVRRLIGAQKTSTGRTISVLLAPSVGMFSVLFSSTVIDTLIAAQKTLGNLLFMVKLHSFCYLNNHPLSGITPTERENLKKIQENFVIIDETQHNILPLLSEFDVIISDLDSSVTFESLYFGKKPRLAYHHVEQDLGVHPNEYLDQLTLFSSPEELSSLLRRISSDVKSFTCKDGSNYFKSLYGVVDGDEVNRIAKLRNWSAPLPVVDGSHPVVTEERIKDLVQQGMREGKFSTPIIGADYLAMGMEIPTEVIAFDRFVQLHMPQLEIMGLPKLFWKTAFDKLNAMNFDAGRVVEMGYDDEAGRFNLTTKVDLSATVDHAWETIYPEARKQLRTNPPLVERFSNMMNISTDIEDEDITPGSQEENDAKGDIIWAEMWKYNMTYNMSGDQIWYLMDEVGSALSHSDEPNYRCLPFYWADKKISISFMWPSRDVQAGQVLTRNFYLKPTRDDLERKSHLQAWFEQEEELFTASIRLFREKYENYPPHDPLPNTQSLTTTRTHYKVYTDVIGVPENLTLSQHFVHVDEASKADILWLADEFKTYAMMSSNQIVNQFVGETCIVFKHMGLVDYLPLTFNMDTQLAEFIGEYKRREEAEESNLWMVKPWNRARSQDMIITDHLPALIRSSETDIENPMLYHGRKFDLRYIVLVKSVDPLEIYIYNMFWIRLANLPFQLEHFEEYERHFTVMNYSAHKLEQLHYTKFISEMESQYPGLRWSDVQGDINKSIRGLIEAASLSEPPYGLGASKQSRSMYGIDIMIDENRKPKILDTMLMNVLEVNFNADTKRACDYDPQYYNNVFSVLFLNEGTGAPTAWTSWIERVVVLRLDVMERTTSLRKKVTGRMTMSASENDVMNRLKLKLRIFNAQKVREQFPRSSTFPRDPKCTASFISAELNHCTKNSKTASSKRIQMIDRPVQLKEKNTGLDVSAKRLEDDDLPAFQMEISQNPHLTDLNVSDVLLSLEGMNVLIKLLSVCGNLRSPHLSDGPNSLTALLCEILKGLPDLTKLNLSYCNIGKDGIRTLTDLMKVHPRLVHIDLNCEPYLDISFLTNTDNDVTDEAAQLLLEAVETNSNITFLSSEGKMTSTHHRSHRLGNHLIATDTLNLISDRLERNREMLLKFEGEDSLDGKIIIEKERRIKEANAQLVTALSTVDQQLNETTEQLSCVCEENSNLHAGVEVAEAKIESLKAELLESKKLLENVRNTEMTLSEKMEDLSDEKQVIIGRLNSIGKVKQRVVKEREEYNKMCSQPMDTLTTAQVSQLLYQEGVPKKDVEKIAAEDINGLVLATLDAELIHSLNVSMATQKKLLKIIARYINGLLERDETQGWTSQQVLAWVREIDDSPLLQQIFSEIDGDALVELKPEDLKSMGVQPFTLLVKISKEIQRLLSWRRSSRCEEKMMSKEEDTTVDTNRYTDYLAQLEKFKTDHPHRGKTQVPEEFLCCITHLPLQEPVVARDGNTYEKCAILCWFAGGKRTSPLTNEELPSLDLVPNNKLRSQIASFFADRKVEESDEEYEDSKGEDN
ncbi:tubulin--tyrosine ligase-like protein 12 [Planoprotostelium fungivorum]|uniref:Tubulin--tyrosine ligase-like protein 12 n=1 Tax=Planoprotostelium fungivorum TaxID=1890364 RepID=A0A2P6ND54_9EUKA|nr:tubulin--tyrosine ligase-like protein 12 [Planoprotostelium fungivorum]